MMQSHNLHLTFIPHDYWNESITKFEIFGKNKKTIPLSTSFFLLWADNSADIVELENSIQQFFPIPARKLLSCRLQLAFPEKEKKYFKIKSVQGKIIPLLPTIDLLYKLDVTRFREDLHVHFYSDSFRFWSFLTKLIFELLNRGKFLPLLREKNKTLYEGAWKLVLKSSQDIQRFQKIESFCPWQAYNLPIKFIQESESKSEKLLFSDSLWHKSYLISQFLDNAGDVLIRSALKKFRSFTDFYGEEIRKDQLHERNLKWEYKFLRAIISKNRGFPIVHFHESIIPDIIQNWAKIFQADIQGGDISFVFELQYPEKEEGNWPLLFSIESNSQSYILDNIWKSEDTLKEIISNNLDAPQDFFEYVIRTIGNASKIFSPIERALDEKYPHSIDLNPSEVMDFMRTPKDLLIQSGFRVKIPSVFERGGTQRLSARMVIRSGAIKKERGTSSKPPSMFNVDSMLDFQWQASLKGDNLTEGEITQLLQSEEPLVNWRGEWILVDQSDIRGFQNLFGKESSAQQRSYIDALKLGLAGKVEIEETGNTYDVVVEGDFAEIINQLQSIESFHSIPQPQSFHGELRPYQKDALTWMGNMTQYGFGLCLADDMGLGKTVQVIAFLLYRKKTYPKIKRSTLIICPTSVLFNWKKEINKFGPKLEVMLHHGSDRIKDASGIKSLTKPHKIILTTFATLRNDIEFLETIPFDGVIVDEIQNIKNYNSQQTKAVKIMQATYRIGLSGTPIENRLMELWTIFDFLNPGLLDSRGLFQKDYVIPIERFQDKDAINRLKAIIDPFILRRVKSDKSIIKDLPEKQESKIYVNLTDEQKNLYRNISESTLQTLASDADQRKKRGLVLGLLTKLKQICNHPLQYQKKDIPPLLDTDSIREFASYSQKMERLLEMTEEIVGRGEKILIFTQFTQMGDLIVAMLNRYFDATTLYFHGGVPEKKRRKIIEKFQSEDLTHPILVLSLRAGGTGLNLTQATTVFHYDRWWNPAVEDQATDRAYRIGQTEIVNVYKFVTVGTIEEKIDALLEEKRDLADQIVASSGESWISDLSEEKLKDLILLSEES